MAQSNRLSIFIQCKSSAAAAGEIPSYFGKVYFISKHPELVILRLIDVGAQF